MSTDTPAGAAADGTEERRIDVALGGHLDGRWPAALDRCVELMREVPGIAHLGRYTNGVCDFALDTDPAPAATGVAGLAPEERQLVDRDVVHVTTDLDAQLRPARSGDLIRVVLHTALGTLFTLQVRREQHLVCVSGPDELPGPLPPREAAARAADVGLSQLANQLREAVSQQPTDYGGWLSVDEVAPDRPDPADAVVQAAGGPRTWAEAESYAGLAATCAGRLGADDLHYAAVCRAGRVEATADLLDDPRLARFFDDITPARRRDFYAMVGQRIDVLLRSLVRAAHPVIGSRVRRLVLDVEEGALYCYPVGLDRYLLGVTLDQHRVWAADEKAAQLSRDLVG
ncbi:hypothetical protein [Micromonospora sp. RTGN7]|uniref:hypothetical protein n=1 Tax=Micromonospora sp. RTGN7 TaxID=3016526 RepID=UPI0029FEE903|nr:hypothetical protein [Micromonospora sp. RTGN7]